MTQAEFKRCLHLGLGRAILYAQSADVHEFQETILDSCLHCYAYDIQIEGTRAAFMHALLSFLPDRAFYEKFILESLAGCEDDRHAVQRFHLAACLASDGDGAAKRALYIHYAPGPRLGELIGVDFLELDGIEGFLFVAAKIGALFALFPNQVDSGYLLSRAEDQFGKEAAWEALNQAATLNPNIAAYIAHQLVEPAKRSSLPELDSLTFSQLWANEKDLHTFRFRQWGERASDDQLLAAANALVASIDPTQQTKLLHIFRLRKFPLDPNFLIQRFRSSNRQLSIAAASALAQINHASVRALALELIENTGAFRDNAVDLLSANFLPGDHQIALNWFNRESDSELLHWIGFSLLDFYKSHPEPETEPKMLHSIYEQSPCSDCRERAVRRWIEIGCLPDQIRRECEWDTNSDIRELVSEL